MFENYKGSRCLITGGAGFIGKTLADKLVSLGAEVNIVDTKPVMGIHDKDVRDYWQMESEFQKTFDSKAEGIVFHLASLTEVADSYKRPHEYYETSILGTLNILELVRKYRDRICRCVVASSDKAYGNSVHTQFDGNCEHHWLHPAYDPYSNSKRHMDNLCLDYMRTYEIPVRVLRSANTYGPGQTNETTLITNVCMCLMRGYSIQIHKESQNASREWLYIDDAVTAYLLAGQYPNKCDKMDENSVWNIGSGEVAEVGYVASAIATILGKPYLPVIVDDGVKRVEEQRLNSYRYHKAAREVIPNYKPITLLSGLANTVEWYRGYYGKKGSA